MDNNKSRDTSKKNFLIIALLSAIFVILIIISLIYFKNKNQENIIINNVKNFDGNHLKNVKLNDYDMTILGNVSSKDNYNKLSRKYNINSNTNFNFNENKYVYFLFRLTGCGEKIKSVKYKNNKINFEIEGSCGVCAPMYKIYEVSISNTKNDIKMKNINIDYKKEKCPRNVLYKPVIYIYPTKNIDLEIKLENKELLTTSYPKYKNKWYINVSSNGNIYDYDTKKNYYALYYESNSVVKNNLMNEGFVIKGEDTIKFLEEKLSLLGLNERESNEFIMYWLPKLEENKYNYIRFETIDEINYNMPLSFSKKPDTLIRIMMNYKPLDKYIKIKKQELKKAKRNGFTIVEWGGSLLD